MQVRIMILVKIGLIYFLKKLTTTNPKEIANQILDRALELQLGEVDDDMTVLVTKVISN